MNFLNIQRNNFKCLIFLGILFIIVFQTVFFVPKSYANTEVASFITAPVWFSGDPTEGVTVSIITAIYNSSKSNLTGTVSFYDHETLLGKIQVSVPGESVRNASILWKVTSGDHRIRAELSNGKTTNGSTTISLAPVTTSVVHEVVASKSPIIPKKKSESNSAVSDQLEAISDLEKKITSSIPDGVRDIASSVEDWRILRSESVLEWKKDNEKEVAEIKAKSIESKENETKEGGNVKSSNVLPSAFAYTKLFFSTILNFILSSNIAFYGSIVFVLIFIGRLILRKVLPD